MNWIFYSAVAFTAIALVLVAVVVYWDWIHGRIPPF